MGEDGTPNESKYIGKVCQPAAGSSSHPDAVSAATSRELGLDKYVASSFTACSSRGVEGLSLI